MESDSPQWCPVVWHKSMGKTGTKKAPSEHQRTLFHLEAAQQGDRDSVLGFIKKLPGDSPRQLDLGDLFWAGRTRGPPGSSCFLHLRPLCDSVICIWVKSLFCRETPSGLHLLLCSNCKAVQNQRDFFQAETQISCNWWYSFSQKDQTTTNPK